jgi:putative copper export protein
VLDALIGWFYFAALLAAIGAALVGTTLVPWTEDAHLLLTGTPWGRAWLWASGATALVVLLGWFARRGSQAASLCAAMGLVALATYPAFSGHASGTGDLKALSIAADTLHVLAAGAWIGGLASVLALDRAWARSPEFAQGGQASLLPVLVPKFSPVALTAFTVLAVTGVFASWLHLDGVGALLTTPYGRLLAAKVALVGVVVVFGAINWRRMTPRLGEADGPSLLRRSAAVELTVANAVLLVTAILVRTSP